MPVRFGIASAFALLLAASCFPAPPRPVLGSSRPLERPAGPIAVADFDRDGILDLALATESGVIQLFRGTDGSLISTIPADGPVVALAASDLNGDGLVDLVAANPLRGIRILTGKPDGSFDAAPFVSVGVYPNGIAIADFDQDGRMDLAVSDLGGKVWLRMGSGEITSLDPGGAPVAIVSADFNADGRADLGVALATGGVSVLLHRSETGFDLPVYYAAGVAPRALASADVNGDGIVDLVVAGADGKLAMLSGHGDGAFEPAGDQQMGGAFSSMAVADRQLLVADALAGKLLSIAIGDQAAPPPNAPPPNASLAPIDGQAPAMPVNTPRAIGGFRSRAITSTTTTLSSAPKPSVFGRPVTLTATVSQSAATGKVTFYDGFTIVGIAPVSSGTATFTTRLLPAGKRSLKARYNGDSGFSASLSSALSHTVSPYTGGDFFPKVDYATGDGAFAVAVGDFNNDGKQDLVVTNFNADTMSILFGNGNGTFQTPVNYATGNEPCSVAVSDFNGDGIEDLIVVNRNTISATGSVSVYLGAGDGTFPTRSDITVGKQPYRVATGDFNMDGKSDIAIVNAADNTVIAKLGNGDGTFALGKTLSTGASPRSVAVGDINADGMADLVVSNGQSNSFSVLRGNGDGTFQAASNTATTPGSIPYGITTADIDGNGKVDVITANAGSGNVGLSLGTNSVPMAAPSVTAVENAPHDILVTDFDGDGNLDAATVNNSSASLTVLKGDGSGGFSATSYNVGFAPEKLAVGDFDGDGRPDLAIANSTSDNVSILLRRAFPKTVALSVSPNQSAVYGQPVTLTATATAATLTGPVVFFDGSTLLGGGLLSNGHASLTTPLLAAGSHSFRAFYPNDPSNAASYSDFVQLTVVANKQNGIQAVVSGASATGTTPYRVVTEDFNHDGLPDMAVGNRDGGNISVFIGNGDGTFQTRVDYPSGPAGTGPWAIAAGDLDGDGNLDLVTANHNSGDAVGSLSILYGKSDGTFEPKVDIDAGGVPDSITLADFNRDGRLDLLVTVNASSHHNAILMGNGDRTFVPPVLFGANGSAASVAVDVNGDGKVDVFTVGDQRPVAEVYLGNGDGTFAPEHDFTVAAGPFDAAFGDFNGDGRLDLVVAATTGNVVSVLINTGNGNFAAKVDYPTCTRPRRVVVADFNSDGKADLAVACINVDGTNGTLSLLLGNGNGTFQSKIDMANGVSSMAAGDFNRDGRVDLAVAEGASSQAGVLLGIAAYPDLTITQTHSRIETAGETAAAFTITVSNVGILPSSGLVTVTDSGSAGSAFQGESGAGWICTNSPQSFQCTRSDALAAGASYPPIVLSERVGATPADRITLTATVSNSLDENSANNTAVDTASILTFDVTSPASAYLGQPVSFTLTAHTGAPTGTVTFYDGGLLLGSSNLAGGTTTFTTSSLSWGPHHFLRAAYSGDAAYDPSEFPIAPSFLVQTLPQNGFAAAVSLTAGTDPRKIALADFNRDGKIDIAVANHGSNTVSVFLGNGDGTFQPKIDYASGGAAQWLVAGDFNGDGIPDLAVANRNDAGTAGNVSVLLGDGSGNGTFLAHVDYAANLVPDSVATGDFNHDGKADLVLGIFGATTSVATMRGNGDGTFQNPIQFGPGGGPTRVAVSDVNSDGHVDIVAARFAATGVDVYKGNGDGTFQTFVNFATGTGPQGMAVAEVFQDSTPSVIVVNNASDTASVLLNSGNTAIFSPKTDYATGDGPNSVVFADFDGDGVGDILTANGNSGDLTLLWGVPGRTFAPGATYAAGSNPRYLDATDFNGDGRPDLVMVSNSKVTIMLGAALYPDLAIGMTHTGNFSQGQQNATYTITVTNIGTTASYGTMSLADTLPPGMTLSSITVSAGWLCPSGSLTCTNSNAIPVGASTVLTLQVNVAANASPSLTNTVTISAEGEINTANNTASDVTGITQVTTTALQVTPSASNLGQLVTLTATVASAPAGSVLFYDGVTPLGSGVVSNGIAILTTSQLSSGAHSLKASYSRSGVYLMSSSGTTAFTVTALPQNGLGAVSAYGIAGGNPAAIVSSDFNGDGIADLAVAMGQANGIAVFLGKADGAFQPAVNYAAGQNSKGIAAGDLNGDGKQDLIVANAGSHDVSLLLGNGDGTFAAPVNVPLNAAANAVALGDFNHDGKTDVAVATGAGLTVLTGDGNGGISGSPVNHSIGVGTAVAVGDFNQDGIADIALGWGGNVSLLRNNADGSTIFIAEVTPGGAASIAVADFNGDGRPDLAVTDKLNDRLMVFIATGDFAFASGISYAAGDAPVSVAVGDFNGDGKPDLIVANSGTPPSFTMLLNNGHGPFAGPVTLAADAAPVAIVTGDFNRDGRVNVAAAISSGSGTIEVLLGVPVYGDLSIGLSHPAGTLSQGQSGVVYTATVTNNGPASTFGGVAVTFSLPAGLSATAVAGAIPNSGWGCTLVPLSCTRSDVLAANTSYPAISLTVTVGINGPASLITTATVTGGGDANLSNNSSSDSATVAPSTTPQLTIAYATSPGNAIFGQPVTLTATVAPAGVAYVSFYDGANLVGTSPLSPAGVATVVTRLLAAGSHSLVAVSRGDGTFLASTSAQVQLTVATRPANTFNGTINKYVTGGLAGTVAAGDFNGDGTIDLVTANAGSSINVFLGNGDGSFQAKHDYPTNLRADSVAVGDFNGDGKLDIVTANENGVTGGGSLFLGNGDGTFQPALLLAPGLADSVATGDFNRDGALDLLFGMNTSGTHAALMLGTGNGTFANVVRFGGGGGGVTTVVGDFNSDGKADFAAVASVEHSVEVYLGNGDGSFQAHVDYPVGSQVNGDNPAAIALGDFNGDGVPDLAVADSHNNEVSILLGVGNGAFQARVVYPVGSSPSGLAVGDINGDGKADLVTANLESANISVLLGNGDGTFQPATAFGAGSGPHSVVIADFNGDGLADLAVTDTFEGKVAILLGSLGTTPNISLSGPADPSKATSASFTFSSADATPFQCQLDGAGFTACTSPKSYAGPLSAAAHTFQVKQTNAGGNTSIATWNWIIDTNPPAINLSGPANPTKSTAATFTFSSADTTAFQCRLGAAAFATCTSPQTYSGLAEGSHTFQVQQTDAAGNLTTASLTWTIDTTPPAISVTGPATPTNATSATFTFSSGDATPFQCQLDAGGFAPCASPIVYNGPLADGQHSFQVTQTDAAGNTATATWNWTIDTTAPTITLSGPPNPTNTTSAAFTFSSSDASAFQCQLDAAAFAVCTSPIAYNGPLAPGSHTFTVKQTNVAGTTATASYTWAIDTAPPVIALAGPSNPTNATSASFTFSSGDATAFQCTLDGNPSASCSSPLTYPGPLAAGPHIFQISQTDSAGNLATQTWNWTIDLTAPVIDLSGPLNPANAIGATFTFSSVEPTPFQCKLDSGAFAVCTSPQAYTGPLTEGPHTFQVTQTDAAGNSTTATWNWTIDTTAPVISLTGPANLTNSAGAMLTFSSSDGTPFQCQLDGAGFAACTSPKNYAGPLADGLHAFQVRQTDAAGNTSSAGATWTIDTTPPAAPAVTGPANPINVTNAGFTFAGEPGGGYQCQLDAGGLAACSSPRTYSGLSAGPHAFQVRQTDAAGNTGAVATYSWTIDLTPPPVPAIGTKPANPSTSTAASFQFTDAEPGVTFICSLDGVAGPCTSPLTYSGLAAGAHTFDARARDQAGNESMSASYSWTINAVAKLSGALVGQTVPAADGSMTITVNVSNAGAATATNVRITAVALRALAGSGTLIYASPTLPIVIATLNPGDVVPVILTVKVPLPRGSVTRFSVTETGSYTDPTGSFSFSAAQTVVP